MGLAQPADPYSDIQSSRRGSVTKSHANPARKIDQNYEFYPLPLSRFLLKPNSD